MPEIDLDAPRPARPPRWTPESLAERFPAIRWREPVMVAVMGVEGQVFVCRTCVANEGLAARDIAAILGGVDPGRRASVPFHLTEERFAEHMLEEHPEPEDRTVPPPGKVPTMPALRRPPGV